MISIIFSTYNGERTLPKMLESICRLSPASPHYSIIVVNNGCTDNSASIINSFSTKLPIKLIEQPIRGKNHALNLAIREELGDLVVFTDDDVIVAPDWLIELNRCAESNPDHDIFGGSILPYWEKQPDDLLIRNIPIGVTYAITDDNLKCGDIFPGLIWGPNMMVRKRLFDEGHQFNSAIGPNGGQYIMGSETEFNLRMAKLGFRCFFCPSAGVHHIIRDYQVDRTWVLRRAFRFGKNKCYQDLGTNSINDNRWLFGTQSYPRWMLRKIVHSFIMGNIHNIAGDQEKSVRYLWDFYYYAGYRQQAQLMRAAPKGSAVSAQIQFRR